MIKILMAFLLCHVSLQVFAQEKEMSLQETLDRVNFLNEYNLIQEKVKPLADLIDSRTAIIEVIKFEIEKSANLKNEIAEMKELLSMADKIQGNRQFVRSLYDAGIVASTSEEKEENKKITADELRLIKLNDLIFEEVSKIFGHAGPLLTVSKDVTSQVIFQSRFSRIIRVCNQMNIAASELPELSSSNKYGYAVESCLKYNILSQEVSSELRMTTAPGFFPEMPPSLEDNSVATAEYLVFMSKSENEKRMNQNTSINNFEEYFVARKAIAEMIKNEESASKMIGPYIDAEFESDSEFKTDLNAEK